MEMDGIQLRRVMNSTASSNELKNAIPTKPQMTDRIVPTNSTDLLFHGIGHVLYPGNSKSVIDYNNYARKILKFATRGYDNNHQH